MGMFGRCCSWMRLRALSCVTGLNDLPVSPARAAVLSAPTPRGGAAGMLRNSRLEISGMIESPFRAPHATVWGATLFASLRHLDVVACRLHVPQRHHGVVLVDHVMAVDRVLMQPIAEAEEQLHPLVGMQLRNILASLVRRH